MGEAEASDRIGGGSYAKLPLALLWARRVCACACAMTLGSLLLLSGLLYMRGQLPCLCLVSECTRTPFFFFRFYIFPEQWLHPALQQLLIVFFLIGHLTRGRGDARTGVSPLLSLNCDSAKPLCCLLCSLSGPACLTLSVLKRRRTHNWARREGRHRGTSYAKGTQAAPLHPTPSFLYKLFPLLEYGCFSALR